MRQEIEALRDGRIDFNGFARATWTEWERLATKLHRAFPTPGGVEVGDVQQEMMLHAWKSIGDWDPKYGTDLTRYVTWTAYAHAKRWVNAQRNSHRRSDKAPGRFPVAESTLKGDRDDWGLGDLVAVQASEEVADARRIFSRVVCSLEPGSAIALEAWAAYGSSEAAQAYLEADPKLRSALNLWTPGSARRLVTKAIETATRTVAGLA